MLIVDGQLHLWEKATPSRHVVVARWALNERSAVSQRPSGVSVFGPKHAVRVAEWA